MVRNWSGDGFGVEEPWSCDPKRDRVFFEKEGRTKTPSCKRRGNGENTFESNIRGLQIQVHQTSKTIATRKVSPCSNPPFPSMSLSALF